MDASNILFHILILTANGLSAILFWWFKKLEREMETIKEEMTKIRTNYRDRFDEIKEILGKGHLDIIERITRLEVLVDNNFKYKRNDNNGQ